MTLFYLENKTENSDSYFKKLVELQDNLKNGISVSDDILTNKNLDGIINLMLLGFIKRNKNTLTNRLIKIHNRVSHEYHQRIQKVMILICLFNKLHTAGTAGIKACGDMSKDTCAAHEAHESLAHGQFTTYDKDFCYDVVAISEEEIAPNVWK